VCMLGRNAPLHSWLGLRRLPGIRLLLSKWYFWCSWGCRESRVCGSIQFGAINPIQEGRENAQISFSL
jgi:hypothetical protein